MAHARPHRSAGERTNLYEQITHRIIAELEAGRVPWVQPWGSSAASIGMPYNAVSDRRYSGINVLTLWDAIVSRGFASHAFLTFRQALALRGHVRRGKHGIGVIYTRRFIPKEECCRADNEGRNSSGGTPFLKWFTVFSVEQRERAMNGIGAALRGFCPSFVLEQVGLDEAQAISRLGTALGEIGANLVRAIERADGGAHPEAGRERGDDIMLADKAGRTGDEDVSSAMGTPKARGYLHRWR